MPKTTDALANLSACLRTAGIIAWYMLPLGDPDRRQTVVIGREPGPMTMPYESAVSALETMDAIYRAMRNAGDYPRKRNGRVQRAMWAEVHARAGMVSL